MWRQCYPEPFGRPDQHNPEVAGETAFVWIGTRVVNCGSVFCTLAAVGSAFPKANRLAHLLR
jgi:hypothetical protein